MQVQVSGRRTTISDELRSQTVDKIGRLEKFLDGMELAEVHYWEEKNPRIGDKETCEVTMEGHGHHVRCKVSAPDGFTALDLAVDKLERQLRKLKTKIALRSTNREKIDVSPELVPESLLGGSSGDEHPATIYKIVKSKRFGLTEMDPQGAALQMDLLNHDFYLFYNSESDSTSVVYRRADGDIGLIETEA